MIDLDRAMHVCELVYFRKSQKLNKCLDMDNILDSAEASLDGLYTQRDMLKGVKQKMLSMVNQLGMSNTLMRLIGKRADQDKLILWGGMIGNGLKIKSGFRVNLTDQS